MISLPIISIAFCFAYVIFILFKYGVPVSISETYYILPKKLDWMFSAWCVLTAAPIGIYWFDTAPENLKWMPIVSVIAMLMIGVSCRYKSDDKVVDFTKGGQSNEVTVKKYGFKFFINDLFEKFKPKNFLKYGLSRPIHYVNSLIVITLSTIYICIMNSAAILSTVLMYVMFIIVGMNVNGVYNPNYSADVDNKTWIFFMECICFINLFVFFWN